LSSNYFAFFGSILKLHSFPSLVDKSINMPSKVSRVYQTHVVSNPYALPKNIQSRTIDCEVCDRIIPSKSWGEHERSRRHREAKEKAELEKPLATASVKSTKDWGNTNNEWAAASVGDGEWGAADNDGVIDTEFGSGDGFTTTQARRGGRFDGRRGEGAGAGRSSDKNCRKCSSRKFFLPLQLH
jgi:hypothetical protein